MFSEIKPKRQDYEIYPYDSKVINQYFMIEKPNGNVIKVSEDVKNILEQMDGDTPLFHIQNSLEEILKITIDSKKLEEFLLYLLKKDLIESESIKNIIPDSDMEDLKPQKRKRLKYYYYFPLFKERTCHIIGKMLSFLFNKHLFILLFISALIINIFSYYSQETIINPSVISIILYFSLTYVSWLFHEFGHIAASIRHGFVPKEAGVGFFLFFPVLYTDLNRVWRIDRMKRAQVDVGGIYLQLVFSAITVLLNLFHPLFSVKSFVSLTLLSMLLNLFPLLRWDGYWFLNDILGINNLNQRGMDFLKTIFNIKPKKLKNKDWNHGLNPKQKLIIPIYAIASLIYLTIMFISLIGIVNSLIMQGTFINNLLNIVTSFSSLDIFGAILLIINSTSDIIIFIFLYMMIKPILKILYENIKKRVNNS